MISRPEWIHTAKIAFKFTRLFTGQRMIFRERLAGSAAPPRRWKYTAHRTGSLKAAAILFSLLPKIVLLF
jgi:hypothetical protein